MGGYHPQYLGAASLILTSLRDGRLQKIRLADPDAGRVDDFQIESLARIDAYQMKWEGYPGTFSFRDLLTIFPDLAAGWKALRARNPSHRIVVHLITNKYPSVNDTRAQSFPSCGEVRKNGQEIPEGEGTWIAFPFHLIGINTGEAFDLEIVNASGVGIGQADFLQSTVSQGRENKRCRAKILWVVAAHGTPFTISGSGSRHSCGFPFHLPCASIELLRTRKN